MKKNYISMTTACVVRLINQFNQGQAAALALLAVLLAIVAATPAMAAGPFYWDNNSTTAGFGTAGGTWSSAGSTNWNGDSAGGSVGGLLGTTITTSTNDTSVNFGTATDGLGAGIVTVSGAVQSGPIVFGAASGAITISGGTSMTLPAVTTIDINNTSNTINTPLLGAATNLTISGGTLRYGGSSVLFSTTYRGTISIGSGANLTYGSSSTASAITNAITGNGSITVNGTGTLFLRALAPGGNTFSGGLNVINGTLNGGGSPNALGTAGVTLGGSGSTGATFIGGQNFGLVNFTNNAPDSGINIIGANGTGGTLTVGAITLNGNLRLQTFAAGNSASTTVIGGVTGAGNLTLNSLNTAGPGKITLSGLNPINNIGSITHQGVGTTSTEIIAPIGANVTNLIQNSATSPLVIYANPSFTGPVVVNAGTLVLNDLFSLPNASSVTISNGGALSLPSISSTIPNLTFVNAGSISFNVAGSSAQLTVSTSDGVTNNGAAGSITLNITGSAPANGSYTLIDYSGNLQGSGFSAYKLGTTPLGKSYSLNDTGSEVQLVVFDADIWTGAQSPEWSTATIAGSKNWTFQGTPIDYTNGISVILDDTATSFTVDVSVANVTPASVSFNNTAQNYLLQGSKAIAGACSLTKDGTGTLTIINSNTYSGPTTITAGTLQLGNGNIGQDGNLSSPIIANSGTLVFNRVGSSTYGGNISGGGVVTMTNTGTQTLSGSNNITGRINVYRGTLLINNWVNGGFIGTVNYGGMVVIGTASNGNFTVNSSGNNFNIGNATLVGQTDGVGTGYQTNGTLNLGGAALNLAVGGTAVYNLIGGTITNTSSGLGQGIRIVANQSAGIGGVATFNQSGGNISMPLGTLEIGRADQQITFPAGATQRATFNQSGGTATVGRFLVGGATGFTAGVFATNNMTGGSFTAATFPVLANGPDDVVAFNLGGSAQVTLPAFPTTRGAGATATMTLDFTTGYLSPLSTTNGYIPAGTFDNAYLTANGAKFNVGTNDITIGQILEDAPSASGTLTKSGAGTLTLSGANTYTGNTTISDGTLAIVQPYLASTSTVSISNAAKLQLDFGTTNVVGALILAGAPQLPGIYNSNNAGIYITGSGSLQVVGSGPSGPAMLTNSVSGGVLSLSWPAGQGWRLEYQTNALNVGLSTNWLPAAGSSVSSTNITIDTTKPTLFYRLIYP